MEKGTRIPLPSVSDGVYLLIGDRIPLTSQRRSAFVGERSMKISDDMHAVKVHVISEYGGGEIRGYFMIGDALHLTLPAYPQQWTEIDAAARVAMGAATVHA